MDEFLKEMADILDEETVAESDPLEHFPAWDSLSVLSVIAMADSKYNTQCSAQAVRSQATLADLYALVSKGRRAG